MRYLNPEIDSKRKLQYIAPRSGVDIPYLGRYFTNGEEFFVKLTLIKGAYTNSVTGKNITKGKDYRDYKDLGYYLFGSDGTNYGIITDIHYSGEAPEDKSYIFVNKKLPIGYNDYYICKYYESLLLDCPTVVQSTKRQGELSRISNISFSIANAEEYTELTGSFGVPSSYDGERLTFAFGDSGMIATANIGKRIVLQQIGGTGELNKDNRIIADVDTVNSQLIISPPIPADSVGYAHTVQIITNNYLSDIFATSEYPEEQDVYVYEYLFDTPNDTLIDETYGHKLFEGKIQEINGITNTEISIIGYDKEEYLSKDIIGNLLTEDDGVLINGATIESLGETKPILIGKPQYFEQINSNYELSTLENDMFKLKYIGIDGESGKKKYYISESSIRDDYKIPLQYETITSGTLISGVTYIIDYYGDGDDFANVGASDNAIGIEFISRAGGIPTDWTNGSILKVCSQISGTLLIGQTYYIEDYKSGDDFSNIGAINNDYQTFIATGRTPTTWTNKSVLKRLGHFYCKNEQGRLCNIDLKDISITDNGSDGEYILEIGRYDYDAERQLVGITDYWYGNKNYKINTQFGATATTLQYANDNDSETYAQSVVFGTTGFAPNQLSFDSYYNNYDSDLYSVNKVITFATAYSKTTSGIGSGSQQLEINGTVLQNIDILNNKKTLAVSVETSDRAGILNRTRIIATGELGAITPVKDWTYRVYEVFKRINISLDLIDSDLSIFTDTEGLQLESGGNFLYNRDANYENPNGGYYLYAHSDLNQVKTIQNPITVIEATLRNTTWGLSRTNSDIDLDSFNRASIARSDWKTVFQLQDQVGSEELLEDMCYQYGCVLYERDDKVAVWAYDSDVPFTNNYMEFDDSRLVADSNILDGATDFEIEKNCKVSFDDTMQIISGKDDENYIGIAKNGAVFVVANNKSVTSNAKTMVLRCSAGRFNFSWNNASGRKWYFPNGTVLYSDGTTPISTSRYVQPDVIIPAGGGFVILESDSFSGNYQLKDNDTDAVYIGDLSDIDVSYYLRIYNCPNITGDLSDINVSYYLDLATCPNITGDLSDLPPLSYFLDIRYCTNITGALPVPTASTFRAYKIYLSGCTGIDVADSIANMASYWNGKSAPSGAVLDFGTLSAEYDVSLEVYQLETAGFSITYTPNIYGDTPVE